VTGLHRLHAVGAFEREPDIGEVRDAQGAIPSRYEDPPPGAAAW
jgi:hypothetical protein